MTDYVKQRATWVDLPSTTTPIRAADLIGFETGIASTSWALPSYAGPRTNLWMPDACLYNFKPSNTRFLRASSTAAASGLGLCRISFSGDSITAGYLGTPGLNDPVTMFLQMLVRRGHVVSPLLHTFDGITGDYVGVDTSLNTGGADGNSTFPWVAVNGGSVSYSGIGTVLDIVSASGNGQPFFYSIDGGAQVSVNVTGSGNHAVMTTVTGLSDGPHTVTVSRNGASGTIYFYAAGFRYPTGFVIENAGITGTTTSDWAAQDGNYGPTWSLLADTANPKRDAVFVSLGVNDFLTSIPVSTMKSNLTTIVGKYQAVNTDVVLMVENRPQNAAGWDAYASGIYDVADTADVPLLDMTQWFGNAATMTLNGHDIGDQVHLTAKGGAHQAEAIGNTVIAEPNARLAKIVAVTSPSNGGTLTIDASTATLVRVSTSVAGFTLAPPTNPSDGSTLAVEILPTVAFALTLDSAILNASGTASPIAVAANKKMILFLRATSSTWAVTSAAIQDKRSDVQTFTGSGTWIKPAGAVWVTVDAQGEGAGGSAGRRGAAASARGGGGGGAGGGHAFLAIPASVLGTSEAVAVGSGATGGPATTVDNTDGTAGNNGAATTFGVRGSGFLLTTGIPTGGGTAGTAGGAAGSGAATAMFAAGSGGAGSSTAGAVGITSIGSAGGGGAGGGINGSDVAAVGGNGGQSRVTGATAASGGATGTAGGLATDLDAGSGRPAGGGAGGGASTTGVAGSGSPGGRYGGGGGGGGASANGNNSGAGGNGGPGLLIATTYF